LPNDFCYLLFGLSGIYNQPALWVISRQLEITLPHPLMEGYLLLLKTVLLFDSFTGKPFFYWNI